MKQDEGPDRQMRKWVSKNLSKVLGALIMVGGLLGVGTGCDSGYTQTAEPEVSGQKVIQRWGRPKIGDSAPSFALTDMQGKVVSLADFKGHVVLLNFWATWCGPCRVEMPNMEAMYKDMKAQGFEILAISTDEEGSAVTKPFVEANQLTFPILHDTRYEVGATYGVRTLPMSYVVDRKGIIQHRIFGARDWHSPEAKDLLNKLLQQSGMRPKSPEPGGSI